MANENGKRISKDEMDKMRKKYNEKTNFVTQSVLFDLATFERLRSVPGVASIRIYYGVNDKDELHPVLVPVDAAGQNIWTDKSESTIEEYGNPCPPFCNE
jgi:hypothetical protein